MEVWEEGQEIVFLYKIGEGAADRSYGIHVARLAGLPRDLIKRAQDILKNLEPDLAYHQLDLSRFFLAEDTSVDPLPGVTPPEFQSQGGNQPSNETGQCILKEMLEADITSWTPLEALNKLADWQTRLLKG